LKTCDIDQETYSKGTRMPYGEQSERIRKSCLQPVNLLLVHTYIHPHLELGRVIPLPLYFSVDIKERAESKLNERNQATTKQNR
jgi:hypothetical protein